MCRIQRPIFVRNWRRWTALGLLRAQKDTDLKRMPLCLEWHEGGVGTETPPRQSLLMLKVGVARSEAGGIAGTRYGLYPKVMGKHLMGGVGAREPDPAQELPLPWPKQPYHQLQGRGWKTPLQPHPAPSPAQGCCLQTPCILLPISWWGQREESELTEQNRLGQSKGG